MFWNCGVGEDSGESLGLQGDQTSQSTGNQPWIFIGRTDIEAEAPIFWLLDAKSRLIGKNPDTGKDWRQEEKGVTKNEMVGWHHWLNGHEFEQTQADNEGQGSLVCCSPWGHKESDMAYWLNNNSPQTNVSLFTSVPYGRPSNVVYKSYYHLTSKNIPSLCTSLTSFSWVLYYVKQGVPPNRIEKPFRSSICEKLSSEVMKSRFFFKDS